MLIPNHPVDERLAAFAGADEEAAGDSSLNAHVASCARCAAVVSELRSLTAALSSLPDPDLVPPRPLQLIPPVPAARPSVADRAGEVMRRIFAPALTAGAVLVLVGAVGTGFPSAMQQAAPGPDAGAGAEAAAEATSHAILGAPGNAAPPSEAAVEAEGSARAGDTFADSGAQVGGATAAPGVTGFTEDAQEGEPAGGGGDELAAENRAADPAAGEESAPAARQIWPMVLFSGVALIILALLGRWVLGARPA